jgi:membrane fusion protein (multidrug efflux system)
MAQKDEKFFPGGQSSSRPTVTVEEEQDIDSVPLYKKAKVVIPLFVIVFGIAAFAWHYYITNRDYVSTDDATIDGNRVSISTKILGRIDSLMADEGDSVYRGQVLVLLDDSDLKAQEAQAQASLALARENVILTRVGLDRAQADYERAATQFKSNVITGEQWDHAQNELESAKARARIAEAQVRTAQAQLGVVENQLGNTRIKAPMNGVISKRWVLPGDVVQPGQAVFTIYDLSYIWVTANLEETHLSMIRLHDRVSIRVDAYPGQELHGTVEQIGANTASLFSLIPPNNAAGNFTKITQRVPVKISIDPPLNSRTGDIRLLPGMSVEVKVKVR